MKKYLTLFLLAATTLCFTSCNRDDVIAYELDGYWEGEVSQTFFNWRGYTTEYQSVDIDFYKSPTRYAEGNGVEYDYDYYGYYTTNYFTYHVHNGYIYLDYEYGQDVVIANYNLYNGYFCGTFREWIDDSYDDSWNVGDYLADFRFEKVSGPYYNYSKSGMIDTRSGKPIEWKPIDNPLKNKQIHKINE